MSLYDYNIIVDIFKMYSNNSMYRIKTKTKINLLKISLMAYFHFES